MTVLPYDLRSDGRIVIEAQVNNQGPFRFAIDTAATGSALFSSITEELELEPVPNVMEIVHGAVATGRFPVVDIDSLRFGNEVWTDVRLIALAGRTGVMATIGQAFLPSVLTIGVVRTSSMGKKIQSSGFFLCLS